MARRKFKVDMTGVESYTRCPEGEWLAKLATIEEGTVQGSGDDCLKAKFEVIKGSAKGANVFETFSLSEKALWKLKGFLEAIGMKANGKLSLDLDKLEGKVCIIDVIHEEYNGQKRAKISSYIKPEDDDEDEEDEEDDEDEDDDEEEAPKKSSKKAPAKPSKKKPQPDDEEEDEDDDEEEEDEPAPKKSSKKSPPAKKATKVKKKPKDEEEDEDDEDDWEDDDD